METVAVIGASPKQERYSNKAMHLLEAHHHRPIPVAPGHKTIEGKKTYARPAQVPDKVDTVTMYVGPDRQAPLVDEIIAMAPARVIFNPGTENRETRERLEKAGIRVQEACTLVLLNTGQY